MKRALNLGAIGLVALAHPAWGVEIDASTAWSAVSAPIQQQLPCLGFQIGDVETKYQFVDFAERAGLVRVTASGNKYEISLIKPLGEDVRYIGNSLVCVPVYDASSAQPILVSNHEIPQEDGTPRVIAFLKVQFSFSRQFKKLQEVGYHADFGDPTEIGYRILFEQDPFSHKWHFKTFDQYSADGTHTDNVLAQLHAAPPFKWENFAFQVKSIGFESGFMARGPVAGNLVSSVSMLGIAYSSAESTKIVYAGITTSDNQYYVVRSDCTTGQTRGVWFCTKPVSVQGVLIVYP